MGRLKINVITMAMMLMVATFIAGLLHSVRFQLGEATEGAHVVYANLAVCGFGALTEGMLIAAVHRRLECVVLLWVVSALVRVTAHTTVAIFLLLPGFHYPSIVFGVYLFVLAVCLLESARRAFLFRAFLRSGRVEVDDNPSIRETAAAVKCQRHWLALNALAANPSELLERTSTAHGGDARVPATKAASPPSNRVTSLLRWERDYGKRAHDVSTNVSTPPVPDRAYGFESSEEESSNSTSIPESFTPVSSTPTSATTKNENISEITSSEVLRTSDKTASTRMLRRPRLVKPTNARQSPTQIRQQRPTQGYSSPKRLLKKTPEQAARLSFLLELERSRPLPQTAPSSSRRTQFSRPTERPALHSPSDAPQRSQLRYPSDRAKNKYAPTDVDIEVTNRRK